MMVTEDRYLRVGEVHCLNCGRALATVVRYGDAGKLQMQPAANQTGVNVVVAGRRMLRCAHCRGRAFVEFLEEPVEERAAGRPAAAEVA